MPVDGQEFMEGCLKSDYIPLPIENHHVIAVRSLKRNATAQPHNDPFDRILLAQAKSEGMTFITNDSLIPEYNESCVLKICNH